MMDEQEALDFIRDTLLAAGSDYQEDVTGWHKSVQTMDLIKYVYSYQLLKNSELIDVRFMGDDFLQILEELVQRARESF